jgi:hypothetical protein
MKYFSMLVAVCMAQWQPLHVKVNVHSTILTPAMCQSYQQLPVIGGEQATVDLRNRTPGLPIVVPRHFWLLRCVNVTVLQTAGGWSLEASSGHFIDYEAIPTFFANDLTFGKVFQHQLINGASSLGLAWSWLRDTAPDISIVCGASLRFVLVGTLGESRVREIAHQRTYACLYVATPLWCGEDGTPAHERPTWDIYGPNIYLHFMPKFFAAMKVFPLPLALRRTVLFLARPPTGKRSLRVLRCVVCNCTAMRDVEFAALLGQRLSENGYMLQHFHHSALKNDQEQFHSAVAAIGVHGGAFTNVMWMSPGSKVVEINAYERLCFAGMSIAGALQYNCYRALRWPGYRDARPVEIDGDDFIRYVVGVLKSDEPQKARAACH